MKRGVQESEEFDALEELGKLLEGAGLTVCLWAGAPPCPTCGGDHGLPADRIETPEWAAIRRRIESEARL